MIGHFLHFRFVWVRSPDAARHAIALWTRRGDVWTTRLTIPLWMKG